MLTLNETKHEDYIGKFAARHSDDKLLAVEAVVRNGTGITGFKLKLPNGESVEVSLTDPEYGWANDKASKRNWTRIKASEGTTSAGGTAVTTARHWLADAPPTTDSRTIFTLPTSRIRYTQDSISRTFSSPTPAGARTVEDAVQMLKTGKDTLAAMPALMIVPSGKEAVRSLDNRRLWVAKRAQVGEPRVRWASTAEQKSNSFKWTGDGKSCRVRS